MTITGSGDVTVTVSDNNYVISATAASANTLSAGDNITITTSGNVDTISASFTFTESDPVFAASAAATITASDISNWNALQGVPTYTASDDGKVLAVTTSGTALGWTTVSGGGVTVGSWEQDCLTISGSLTTVSNWTDWVSEYTNGHIYEYIKDNSGGSLNGVYKYNGFMNYNTGTLYFVYTCIDMNSKQYILTITYNSNNNVITGVQNTPMLTIPDIDYYGTGAALTVSSGATKTMSWKQIYGTPNPSGVTAGNVLTVSGGQAVWAAPAAVTVSAGVGIEVDSRDNTISIGEIESVDTTTDVSLETRHYYAPDANAESMGFERAYAEWTQTGEIDENEDPIYEWQDTDTHEANMSADSIWVVKDLPQTNEHYGNTMEPDAILFNHRWEELDENEDSVEIEKDYEWCPDHIELKDATTGHTMRLTIDNGQISIEDLDESL